MAALIQLSVPMQVRSNITGDGYEAIIASKRADSAWLRKTVTLSRALSLQSLDTKALTHLSGLKATILSSKQKAPFGW